MDAGKRGPGRSRRGRSWIASALALAMLVVVGCGGSPAGSGNGDDPGGASGGSAQLGTIMFAGLDWDTSAFDTAVARFVMENGYGYQTDEVPGSTIPLMQGMARGDLDVMMEVSMFNAKEAWEKALATGNVVDLGMTLTGVTQGFYVPTYVIKGDPSRGLEPLAPDLKSVDDLPRYWHLFTDPEDPTKGRFYDCIAGWECEKINGDKFEAYGLDATYNRFRPGTAAALDASLVGAYKKGEPWAGYYWEPTWILGLYDMTRLAEPEYTEECWRTDKGCAYPNEYYHVGVSKRLYDQAPELVEFLTNYEMTVELMNEMLAYMAENELEPTDAARYFLATRPDIWEPWVPADVAAKVKAAL